MFGDGKNAEVGQGSDAVSQVAAMCPHDVAATADRPGDVLTDVVLRLTFDNTAYVEQLCDDAEASALLPDILSGNSPSVFLPSVHSTDSLQSFSSSD